MPVLRRNNDHKVTFESCPTIKAESLYPFTPHRCLPMSIAGAPLHTSHEQLLEMVRNDDKEDLSKWAWEAALTDENEPTTAEMAKVVHGELRVEVKNWLVERHCTDEDVIAIKMMSSLKELVTKEWMMLTEESLPHILRKSFYNARSGFRSDVKFLGEQVMMDLLRKDVTGKTLGSDIAEYLDNDAETDRRSKKFLTSSSFVVPAVTFDC